MSKLNPATQYAALPYRIVDGEPEIMLITSRQTRRWIIPKGWAERNVKPHDMAAREAYEEAGIRGSVGKKPFGTYHYVKRLTSSRTVPCKVTVFLLRVDEECDDWPEKAERERRWLSLAQAASLATEGGLVEILLRFAVPES